MGVVLDFLLWLARKIGVGLLLSVVLIAAWATVLYVRGAMRAEEQRLAEVGRLEVECLRVEEALRGVSDRLAGLRASYDAQAERARRLDSLVRTLSELQDWWNRWFGDPEQYRRNRERLERARADRESTLARLATVQRELEGALGEHAALAAERDALERRLAAAREEPVLLAHLRGAWERARWPLAILLLGYFFGPTAGKLAAFHLLAPLVSRGRPVLLREEARAPPEPVAAGVSVEVDLWPGESLWVKESFLQASDEGLRRRTRLLLDWSIPLTSLSCRLVELVELIHAQAGEPRSVTLSDQEDPHNELAVLRVPEGGSLILRPSSLVGLVKPREARLVIRRHWRLFRWQSWVTGQFRFFEFEGPARLVVAGSRGIRIESLRSSAPGEPAARRTNQDSTIGFTPNLAYRPVRAETFWSYYRGHNPLFDDRFEGEGLFLCQEVAPAGAGAAKARRFWARLWDAVLKVFGM